MARVYPRCAAVGTLRPTVVLDGHLAFALPVLSVCRCVVVAGCDAPFHASFCCACVWRVCSGRVVSKDAVVSTVLEDGDDVFIRSGVAAVTPVTDVAPVVAKSASITATTGSASEASAGSASATPEVLCRNFGCNKKFREEDNHDAACHYHTKPPIFHETRKGWSCCSEKLVWDWDEFMKIEGCTVGRHSTVDPKVRFAPSPTVSAAAAAGSTPVATGPSSGTASPAVTPTPAAPRLKSVEEYNRENPNAVTAASAAVDLVTSGPKRPVRTDGKAVCNHNACKKEFVVADNHDTACSYHKGGPVFHDAGKYWSCCPTQVKYDFDEFLAVPPCTTGPHEE